MYILTQDEMRILSFRDEDSIALEEEGKFDYELMKYSEKDTAFYLYLYRNDLYRNDLDGTKELLGTFDTKERGAYAISEIGYAIENRRNYVEIPCDRNNKT